MCHQLILPVTQRSSFLPITASSFDMESAVASVSASTGATVRMSSLENSRMSVTGIITWNPEKLT